MHSLQELMADLRKDSDLCEAVERGGVLCFKKRARYSKYCGMHRSRLHRFKSFNLPVKKIKKCKMIDCDLDYAGNGYCQKHASEFIYYQRNRQKPCDAEGCNNRRRQTGKYCGTHGSRLSLYGNITETRTRKIHTYNFKKGQLAHNKGKFKILKCIVPGCEKENSIKMPLIKGLCSKHRARWIRYGDYNIASKKEYELKRQDAVSSKTS